jgi:hypothetical protein
MNRGRVGEERRGKETYGCPLTLRRKMIWHIQCLSTEILHINGEIEQKMAHFEKHWDAELQQEVLMLARNAVHHFCRVDNL